jgi:DNA-binding transcriptional LysR family regulator
LLSSIAASDLFEKSFDLIGPIARVNFATFDMNLLRVLDALLREGSTVKAGERLGMSQSAVSGALARLRHALGDELFVRHGQGLRPTDYAVSLSLPLNAELTRLEMLLAPITFDPANSTMNFKMAASDFFAEMLMPVLARELRNRAPNMRAQLVDVVPYSYIDSLERYEADLALIPSAEFPDWTDSRPLFYSSFVAIAARDNPVIAPEQVWNRGRCCRWIYSARWATYCSLLRGSCRRWAMLRWHGWGAAARS